MEVNHLKNHFFSLLPILHIIFNILILFFPFRVRKPETEEPDFTDKLYQEKLPMHARSTASKAVKNNLRITETMADPNLILSAQKVCKCALELKQYSFNLMKIYFLSIKTIHLQVKCVFFLAKIYHPGAFREIYSIHFVG